MKCIKLSFKVSTLKVDLARFFRGSPGSESQLLSSTCRFSGLPSSVLLSSFLAVFLELIA